ncbi:helix-turn-helix domain-containing protein [Oscillospiraceae bacterium OttesenSCG-928-G22]|nr:helix-turn-helix domain-containing protein [Oscillospiraceae bacterium OttesenSCG-928-G22]
MKSHIEILRELREDRDLKQVDVAEMLGTTQQYYSKYETGKFELPIRMLSNLADFYNVSTDYLLGRTESREGIDGLNKTVADECTVGRMVSDVMALPLDGRRSVIEYIELQRLKQTK